MPKITKPLKGDLIVTSRFGQRTYRNSKGQLVTDNHTGTDFRASSGTDVIACFDYEVIESSYNSVSGNVLRIKDSTGRIRADYAHLSKKLVAKGHKGRRGEVIALTGASGNVTGAHLHFGLYDLRDRKFLDPVELIGKEPTPTTLPDGQYQLKSGGWVWNVVDELVRAGFYKQNTESTRNDFFSLNNPTPKGGYKAGMVVRVRPIATIQPQTVQASQSEPVTINFPETTEKISLPEPIKQEEAEVISVNPIEPAQPATEPEKPQEIEMPKDVPIQNTNMPKNVPNQTEIEAHGKKIADALGYSTISVVFATAITGILLHFYPSLSDIEYYLQMILVPTLNVLLMVAKKVYQKWA